MLDDVGRYRTLAQVRAEQLTDEDEALRRWLAIVQIFGWPLVILSLVCPIAAGSVSLASALGPSNQPVIAILSFVGAAAVALHRGLNCETYQQAIKRTVQSLRSITEDFEAISAARDEEVIAAFKDAEARLRELRASSSDLPPRRRRRFDELCRPDELSHA